MIPFIILFPIFYAMIRSFTLLTKYFYSLSNNEKVWKSLSGKWVLITNVNSEFEEKLCLLLSRKNVKLLLLGPSDAKLQEIKSKFANKIEIVCHSLDLVHQKDFSFLEKYDIGLVINKICPYSTKSEYFIDQNIDYLVDSCIKAPMNLLKTIMNSMAEAHKGFVVNIGFGYSVKPSPKNSLISSIKAEYKSWTESMYYEMMPYNVNVEYMEIGTMCFSDDIENKPSVLRPSVHRTARSVINSLGSSYFTVPYYSHFLLYTLIFVTPKFLVGRLRNSNII
jgi:17beta-estradiol 17-dehydrogenase / very-long-chain 3-oxoacyl-CoA reductase